MLERQYISGITGVETLADAIEKLAPILGTGGGSEATQAAQSALEAAQTTLAEAQEVDVTNAKRAKTQEGQGADIEGMDSSESSDPTVDVDSEVDAPQEEGLEVDPKDPNAQLTLSIDRNWFVDNFGMSGSEMASLLIMKEELSALDALYPLLIEEKKAILSVFPGVSPELVKHLPLTDVDYDSLNKYSDRLGIPFRRFVKMWKTAEDATERAESYNLWRTVIDASQRLSTRERTILKQVSELLLARGALNAQTLKFNGVPASPAEISSLIKSHGFLFDIISVGEVSKSVGRGLFYDVKRRDVILKDAPRFIAGLLDNNSTIKFDSRMTPRIELGFTAPTAPWYASALNSELGTESVSSISSGLMIEGGDAVLKALDMALVHVKEENHKAFMLEKALKGDKEALMVMAHDCFDAKRQVKFLKSKNVSVEEFDIMKEKVMNRG